MLRKNLVSRLSPFRIIMKLRSHQPRSKFLEIFATKFEHWARAFSMASAWMSSPTSVHGFPSVGIQRSNDKRGILSWYSRRPRLHEDLFPWCYVWKAREGEKEREGVRRVRKCGTRRYSRNVRGLFDPRETPWSEENFWYLFAIVRIMKDCMGLRSLQTQPTTVGFWNFNPWNTMKLHFAYVRLFLDSS